MSKRCLIVGRGSFGDLFPLFAVAIRLRASGWQVSVLADDHHRESLRPTGIPFIGVGPPQSAAQRGGNALQQLFRALTPKGLEAEFEMTRQAAQGADVIVGNQNALVGRLVSKFSRIPWVYCPVSPLALLSGSEQPLLPVIGRLQHRWRGHEFFQRSCMQGARAMTRLLLSQNISFQKSLGVWDGKHPRFEGLYSDRLNLLLTTPGLLAQRVDWPDKTLIPGFAWFEPEFMEDPTQDQALAHFLQHGDAPVVIAPGGLVRVNPGAFYQTAIAAVRRLGLRALVVAGSRVRASLPSNHPDLLVLGYMPYAKLLREARLLIHSGGIGALGWALKAGLPSLIVPAVWDQFDNAALAERSRVGCVDWRGGRDVAHLADLIRLALHDPSIRLGVSTLQQAIAHEDGAQVASQAISALLDGRGAQLALPDLP